MAVSLNASSATVTITGVDRIVPTVAVVRAGVGTALLVNAHLSNNFDAGATRISGAKMGDAWHAVGKVGVGVSPGDAAELAQWNFGFIQFQKINALTLYYNGTTRSGGGLVVQVHLPPAMSRTLGRDSGAKDPNPPWLRMGTAGTLTVDIAKGVATAETGDHPMVLVATDLQNRKTVSANYLSQLVDDRQFVTVFSARDPQGVYTHLAHFAWSVVWDFNFVWANSAPRPRPGGPTRFKMGPVVLGAPTDPSVAGFLSNPAAGAKLGTSEQQAALISSIDAPPPNRIDSEDPIGNYPDDFYIY